MRLVALVFMLIVLSPAHADLLDDCTQGKKVEAKIRGCTHLIEQERFRKLPPNTQALVYYSRAFGYYERGDLDRARLDTTEALNLKPDDMRFILLRGTISYEQGRSFDGDGDKAKYEASLESAFKDFSRIIETEPSNAQAYSMRGLVYHDRSKFETAVEEQTKAIGINPKYVDAYMRRGQAHGAQALLRKTPGARERAMDDFRTVLKLNPKHREARKTLQNLRDFVR